MEVALWYVWKPEALLVICHALYSDVLLLDIFLPPHKTESLQLRNVFKQHWWEDSLEILQIPQLEDKRHFNGCISITNQPIRLPCLPSALHLVKLMTGYVMG